MTGEWENVFNEGIGLVLGRWLTLQYAIEQGWCDDGNPHVKAQHLAENIYSWFIQSKILDVYDLETILDETMDSFQLIHQDGSVEEVAKVLMKLHEECLVGNFKSVERLREATLNPVAHPPVGKVVNGGEDDEDSDSDEGITEDDNSANMDVDNSKSESNMNFVNRSVNGSQPKVNSDESIIEDNNAANMDVDNTKSESNMNSANKPVNESQPEVAGKADDGWSVVSNRKNKGRKKLMKIIMFKDM